jgi:hypothetical protein
VTLACTSVTRVTQPNRVWHTAGNTRHAQRDYRPELCETCVLDLAGIGLMRFRRALDRQNVTEALSVASELPHVRLAEARELCLLLRDKSPERYRRAALRWHGRLCRDVDVSLEEAQAVLAALVLLADERKSKAAFALADLLSRRGLERSCETLVAWARGRRASLVRRSASPNRTIRKSAGGVETKWEIPRERQANEQAL